MILSLLTRTTTFILRILQLQIILTFVSLPILIAWGLPFSLLSFIGNIIFPPFLSLFLLISSLIFFCEILWLPSGYLIFLLDQLTSLWCYIINSAPNSTLVGYANQPLWILCLLPLMGFVLLGNPYIRSSLHRIILCTIILCLFIGYVQLTRSYTTSIHRIPCRNNQIILIENGHTITIVDNGALGRHPSASSYAEYTLLPAITKLTGAVHIDNLILLNPGKRLFDAIRHLCSLAPVKTLYLVVWNGSPNVSFLQSFNLLRTMAKSYNIQIKRIGKNTCFLQLSEEATLTITPTQKRLSKVSLSLFLYKVSAEIDNECITLYDSE